MNDFLNFLQKYNQEVAVFAKELFEDEKEKISQIVPFASNLVTDYENFLLGGKKLRGCEIFLGHKIFGGKDQKIGLLASLTIEIIHSFLLMHDDIMDRDILRRGKPTLHKKYATQFIDDHLGISMAMNLGDMGIFFAYRLLNSLNLPADRLSFATKFLSELLIEVGVGQALDLAYEKEKKFEEEAVLRVHRYKTADYTISGPLSIGAILAGASQKDLNAIFEFGIPVGIAFQLRDDELGMFSTEEELGKPVDSDLKEGKITILMVKALEKTNREDRKFLEHAHGNKNLKKEELEKVREILKQSGAFEYSQKLARKLVAEGKKFIPEITSNSHYKQMLSELADFVIERGS